MPVGDYPLGFAEDVLPAETSNLHRMIYDLQRRVVVLENQLLEMATYKPPLIIVEAKNARALVEKPEGVVLPEPQPTSRWERIE